MSSQPWDTESNVAESTSIPEKKIETDERRVGLSREELEKYRNDPFWRQVRYFFFGLYWVAWLAMIGGAVAIVATSGKIGSSTTAAPQTVPTTTATNAS
ncbi:unnamed protein product, partial [Mesorhabditis belari]|uniref:Solute carrier family 3 member 2 N-terminal domain-containing protein n=1 Tax=Mesorhabditis belari TaxID=2138241 RepID=A0AAF3FEF9_9BILA